MPSDATELNGAADVDKRESNGNTKRHKNAVERDVPAWSNSGQKGTERDAVVASKGEELARACCHIVDTSKHCHDSRN